MRVILFSIGSFSLRSYGTILALAIMLALGVAYSLASDEGEKNYRKHLLDVTVWGIVGGIIGARIWQVFFYEWDYYSQHLIEIPMIWQGGMSILGTLVGAVVAGLWYARKHKIDFWVLADVAAPGLIFGQAAGRIACLLNGDAYGTPTNLGYGLVYPPGTAAYSVYGNQPLWPAEVWEGQWDMVVFAVLLILSRWRKWPKGILFVIYIILYSLGRFSLEFLRGDSPHIWGLTTAQWSNAGMIAAAIIVGIILSLRLKSTDKAQAKKV